MITLPSIAISAGTVTYVTTGQNCSAIVITNESPLSLFVTLGGLGNIQQIAAYTIDCLHIPNQASYSGNISVNPIQILNNSSSSSSSDIIVTIFGVGESITGTYPVALQRLTNIGNSVSTVSNAANSLVNTTSAPGTQIFDIQPTDATTVLITADTSGNLTWKGDNAGTLTTLLQLIAGASPAVKLAAAAILTEVLGNLKVDGTFESVGAATLDSTLGVTGATTLSSTLGVTGAATLSSTLGVTGVTTLSSDCHISGNLYGISGVLAVGDHLKAASSSDLYLDCPSGQNIKLNNNGTLIATIDGSGITLNGSFNLSVGSSGVFRFRNGNTTQAWGNFSGTGSGTYNHGFGSAPFAVIPIVDVVGSATQGYDSITSTQVHITLGASLGFRATMWS